MPFSWPSFIHIDPNTPAAGGYVPLAAEGEIKEAPKTVKNQPSSVKPPRGKCCDSRA
jgi:hypothetical protein